MFDIGDKVVYPMHGAGIIVNIEKKEILGELKDYLIMQMPIGDMKVIIRYKMPKTLSNKQRELLKKVKDKC